MYGFSFEMWSLDGSFSFSCTSSAIHFISFQFYSYFYLRPSRFEPIWNLFLKQMIFRFRWTVYAHFTSKWISIWNECRSILIAAMSGETIIIMIILLFLLPLSMYRHRNECFEFEIGFLIFNRFVVDIIRQVTKHEQI